MKVLLAVDGSEYTKRLLSYLGSHKDSLGSGNTYTVLHVTQPMPYRAAAFMTSEDLDSYYGDEARVVLDPIRAMLAEGGIDADVVHKVGAPADEVCAYAEEGKFDLVAMGSHGHGVLGNLVLGSVATKVLGHCKVPVLLVR